MQKQKVIALEPKERLLEKARRYASDPELFLENGDLAVSLMLRALKFADRELKWEILLLLGSFAKNKIALPLMEILADPAEEEDIRRDASIQLSIIGPFLKDPQPVLERLMQAMESPDPALRLHATFAAGWPGNIPAAIPLMERLFDGEDRVQQTAVNALCNLRDDRILNLLQDRLENGPLPQKRTILLNLWRFSSKQEEAVKIYLKFLEHENSDLRLYALAAFGLIADPIKYLEVYRKCLRDPDSRVRQAALRRLVDEDASGLFPLREVIQELLDDPVMQVKKAALAILKKF